MLNTMSLKLEFISFMQQNSQEYQLFVKCHLRFPEKFYANFIKMGLTYFTLSNDQSGVFSQIRMFNTLNQIHSSYLNSQVMIGTKTNKWIDKGYLRALYGSKSSTGIVVKLTLRGIRCLVFILDRNLVRLDNLTDILWDDVDDNKIEYCKSIAYTIKLTRNNFKYQMYFRSYQDDTNY